MSAEKEKTIVVDNKPVEISEDGTVAEAIEKAGLPKNVKAYDVESGDLLNSTDKAPSKIGAIEPFKQG
jgi:sulfur carrier protein ThiS